MPRVPPPRRGPIRNNRILSLLRRQLRRPFDANPNTLLAENGKQLTTENGTYIQTG
jgi:hypothetical protein